MRRIIIITILIFSGILCACHRNINTVDNFERATTTVAPIIETESQPEDNYTTIEKSDEPSDIAYSMVDIQVPTYATLSSYCLYGNLVYYSYYYLDYIYVTGEVELSDSYKSQICAYDIATNTSKVIYTVDSYTEYIPHLSCNGEQLLFVQEIYMGQDLDSKVYLMDLSLATPQAVSVLIEGNVKTAELVENYIMWISQGSESQTNSICRYDYKTGETIELIKEVVAYTFELNKLEKIITICNVQEDGSANIKAYDFNGKLVNSYVVDNYVSTAQCNSKYVVWSQDYNIFIFDFDSEQIYKTNFVGDFVLINDFVISEGNEGIFSYKIGDGIWKCIIKTEEEHRTDIKNTDGKIYGKWYISGKYAMPWDEDVVTIIQIPIDNMP